MLTLLGFLLVISQNLTSAETVTVGAIVQGPPPTVGATISSPIDGLTVKNLNPTQVSGTCSPESFVVVYNDGVLSSSTICTTAGIFSLTVQLREGKNVLTARNFDAINQPGPNTASVTVTFVPEEPTKEVVAPITPESPLVIPGVTKDVEDCSDYKHVGTLPTGGQPHVAVVCVPRAVAVGEDRTIGVLVWGGQPPYALNFKWGAGSDTTLISMDEPGYRTVSTRYASSGIYNINIQLTDHTTKTATGDSAIQVTGSSSSQPFGQVVNSLLGSAWFETPVPLYLTAVGITLGFWGGDIFNRFFGAKGVHTKTMTYPRRRY
jgi:hypothetical protein